MDKPFLWVITVLVIMIFFEVIKNMILKATSGDLKSRIDKLETDLNRNSWNDERMKEKIENAIEMKFLEYEVKRLSELNKEPFKSKTYVRNTKNKA